MAVIEFLVYITCFCLAQDLVFCDDYGESGNDITLTPSIRGKPQDILWRHNGNKVLEYDGSEVVRYGLFKGRVDVDFETGQLIIRKLNSQDSGKYQSEILINGIVQTSSHTLTVLDVLPEPQVTCEVDENSNVKKLSCSVESQTQPSYEWSGPDIKQPGPTLLVNEQEEKHDSVYTCTVKNKAGIKTTDFNLQDCHTGGVGPAVLVPVLIVAVLLIILLAVLTLYLCRRKKQKLGKSEMKKMDPENGECDNLLINVIPEVMPGSFEATLPCCTRLTAPKESIADKKWDQDSELEDAGETQERQKLLKESPQSAITEKNKEVTGNTNERELGKNKKNSENAADAEENTNSKPDETATEVESQKSLQTQEEKDKSQILKNESEYQEESPEEQIEPPGEQETKDANKKDQTPGEIKEKEEKVKEIDSPNTESVSRSTMDTGNEKNSPNENGEQSPEQQNKSPCTDINEGDQRLEEEEEKTEKENHEGIGRHHTEDSPSSNLKVELEMKQADQDSGLENVGETHEGQKPLKESPHSAIAEENKVDTRNTSEEELDKNEKNRETLGEPETEDANKNEEDQMPGDEKEEEDRLNTESVSRSTMDTGNEKNSPNENGEQSPEQQNKSPCTDINEGDQRLEEEEEKTEKENHEGIGRHHTEDSPSSNLKVELEMKQADQDSGLENVGETHEGQKPLKESPHSAIAEENKVDTRNTSEEELDKNEKNRETLGEPETEDANKNEEDQMPGDEKEEEDRLNTESVSRSTMDTGNEKNSPNENGEQSPEQQNKSPCTDINEGDQRLEEEEEKTEKENHEGIGRHHTEDSPSSNLKVELEMKQADQDSGLENVGETHEGQKPLKESPHSAIAEENKVDTRNTSEEELDKNEKNRETLGEPETEDANKNEEDQMPGDEKEEEDRLNTGKKE